MYRHLTLGALATISAVAILGTSNPASAAPVVQDAYCLQGRQSGYPGNCQFSTYQQCMATASGTNEGCGISPMRAFAPQGHFAHQNRY
jgi:Protein of unknown function (DUF3551)